MTKHVNSLEANQIASQERLLSALSELTNGLVNSKHERAKTLEVLTDAQKNLSQKIEERQEKEQKPLMLVIPGEWGAVVTCV